MPRAILFLTVAVLAAAPVSAQTAPERMEALTLPDAFAADAGTLRAPSPRSFLGSPAGRAVTGAAIGGWLGYFASHVATSDWDDSSARTSRIGWAAAGVLAGAVTGLIAPLRSPGGPVTSPADVPSGLAASRAVIELDEIRASGATNAYELIRSVRKEWLMPRGVNSFTESARGRASLEEGSQVVPGADHILVYLDNARLGGTQHLEEVSLAMIERMEFIPGSQATFRWGTGHAHGVILLTTRSAETRQ